MYKERCVSGKGLTVESEMCEYGGRIGDRCRGPIATPHHMTAAA